MSPIQTKTAARGAIALSLVASALVQPGCSSSGAQTGAGPSTSPPTAAAADSGSVGAQLTLPGGQVLNTLTWTVTGPNGASTVVQSGTVSIANSAAVSFLVGGIPAGTGYTISASGTSTDGTVTCGGSATFAIAARQTTNVSLALQCNTPGSDAGSALVNGTFYGCSSANSITALPAETTVGSSIALTATANGANPAALTYVWSAPSGTFSAPNSPTTNFTCTTQGPVTVTVTAGDGPVPDGSPPCAATTATALVTCDALSPSSLVISSSTYSSSQGPVSTLAIGTTLPNKNGTFNANGTVKTAATTAQAVATGDYVNVWNNDTVDGSFGVTSAIQLTVINPSTAQVLNTISVPTSQVVTSFPSKSELGLHYVTDANGGHLTFVAYAGASLGALDVSNSDAVPGQDPTNAVTAVFGSNYAFARTIVSMDVHGNFAYTPTNAYGGNNGRSALLGSNGLYYAVGNANNGGAATFGPNGTSPDVTETTGLEVVTPINGATSNVAIPPNNSAEVEPLIQLQFLDGGLVADGGTTVDKAGKDDNFRGLTEFGGALYFTKGSGGNGIDTVYTVPTLPTVANAASQTITVVPGFPTDQAKLTNGNFTPFAMFFANATTMYVTDEGTGGTADASHAGLEKWSLVSGTWQLDYVLTNGLIGTVDSNLTGSDGPWPNVTTVGLRNLTGVVNASAGTVSLWATTSTSSTSGDNGADPNKVVTITDQLAATTPAAVASEAFSVVAGPTYGTVYRGVAYVP